MPKRITTDDFVKRARKVHGERYDYSPSTYVHQNVDVEVICKSHGSFYIQPFEHISLKRGCTKCFFDKKRNSVGDFIKKSRNVHGKKYDYSKVEYVNNCTNVIVGCPIHGEFSIRPSHHTDGRGCAMCAIENQRSSTNDFVRRSHTTHLNKYDYSKTKYVNVKTKVKIICPNHGEFFQRPSDHIKGQGCPKCGKGRISKQESEFLDYVKIRKGRRQFSIPNTQYQVDGISVKTVYEFLGDYWHGNPEKYKANTKIMGSGLTCGDCFTRTLKRFETISSLGYTVKYIWESDWKEWKRTKVGSPKIQTFKTLIDPKTEEKYCDGKEG